MEAEERWHQCKEKESGEQEHTQAGRGGVDRKWHLSGSRPLEQGRLCTREGQPRGLICMEPGRERRLCDEHLKEEWRELPRNYSNRGVCREIKYQVVTSLCESYLLAGSFTFFLT